MTNADARFVTLIVTASSATSEVQVATGEVAELRGYSGFMPFSRDTTSPYALTVTKDRVDLDLLIPPLRGSDSNPGIVLPQHVIAGPARIRIIKLFSDTSTHYCTFNITPEAFPPDRTILVPPGTNLARITLECSTNLVHWASATNGVYGPLPEAKFFRIKMEPVP